jgi:cell division protein ZapA
MPEAQPLKLSILGKTYHISCPAGEEPALQSAADYLNEKMTEIKKSGRVIGADRIAVMAALNITHELLSLPSNNEEISPKLKEKVQIISKKIDEALHP